MTEHIQHDWLDHQPSEQNKQSLKQDNIIEESWNNILENLVPREKLDAYTQDLLAKLDETLRLDGRGTIKLRKLQRKSIRAFIDFLQLWKKQWYFKLPTWSGKTILFTQILDALDMSSIITAPKKTLVKQIAKTYKETLSYDNNKIKTIEPKSGYLTATRQATNIINDIQSMEEKRKWSIVMTGHTLLSLEKRSPQSLKKLDAFTELYVEDEWHRALWEKTVPLLNSLTADASRSYSHWQEVIDELLEQVDEKLAEDVELLWEDTDASLEEKIEVIKEIINEELDQTKDQEALSLMEQKKGGKKIHLLFTATPNLLEKWLADHYHKILSIKTEEAVEDWSLILPEHEWVWVAYLNDMLDKRVSQRDLNNRVKKFVTEDWEFIHDVLIDKYLEQKEQVPQWYLPSLAVTADIPHAEFIRQELQKKWIRAVRVTSANADYDHGVTEDEAEEMLLKDEVDVVITVNKLSEGWDVPLLRWFIRFAPTLSPAKQMQPPGRIMRTMEDSYIEKILLLRSISWINKDLSEEEKIEMLQKWRHNTMFIEPDSWQIEGFLPWTWSWGRRKKKKEWWWWDASGWQWREATTSQIPHTIQSMYDMEELTESYIKDFYGQKVTLKKEVNVLGKTDIFHEWKHLAIISSVWIPELYAKTKPAIGYICVKFKTWLKEKIQEEQKWLWNSSAGDDEGKRRHEYYTWIKARSWAHLLPLVEMWIWDQFVKEKWYTVIDKSEIKEKVILGKEEIKQKLLSQRSTFLSLAGRQREPRKLYDSEWNIIISYVGLCRLFGFEEDTKALLKEDIFIKLCEKLFGENIRMKVKRVQSINNFKRRKEVKWILKKQLLTFLFLPSAKRQERSLHDEEWQKILSYIELLHLFDAYPEEDVLYKNSTFNTLCEKIFWSDIRSKAKRIQNLIKIRRRKELMPLLQKECLNFVSLKATERPWWKLYDYNWDEIMNYRDLADLFDFTEWYDEVIKNNIFKRLCYAIFWEDLWKKILQEQRSQFLSMTYNDRSERMLCDKQWNKIFNYVELCLWLWIKKTGSKFFIERIFRELCEKVFWDDIWIKVERAQSINRIKKKEEIKLLLKSECLEFLAMNKKERSAWILYNDIWDEIINYRDLALLFWFNQKSRFLYTEETFQRLYKKMFWNNIWKKLLYHQRSNFLSMGRTERIKRRLYTKTGKKIISYVDLCHLFWFNQTSSELVGNSIFKELCEKLFWENIWLKVERIQDINIIKKQKEIIYLLSKQRSEFLSLTVTARKSRKLYDHEWNIIMSYTDLCRLFWFKQKKDDLKKDYIFWKLCKKIFWEDYFQ